MHLKPYHITKVYKGRMVRLHINLLKTGFMALKKFKDLSMVPIVLIPKTNTTSAGYVNKIGWMELGVRNPFSLQTICLSRSA